MLAQNVFRACIILHSLKTSLLSLHGLLCVIAFARLADFKRDQQALKQLDGCKLVHNIHVNYIYCF